MMVAVVAVAAGSVGLVSVPAQAEPPPPDVKEVAVEEGVAAPAADGIAGTPVVADQTGTVDVVALAAEAPSLPASPDEPVEVPLGDAPDLPTGALDPDLIRPDDPSVTGTSWSHTRRSAWPFVSTYVDSRASCGSAIIPRKSSRTNRHWPVASPPETVTPSR